MTTTTNRTPNKLTSRSYLRAAVMGLALALTAIGCGAPEEEGTVGTESVQCTTVRVWTVGDSYKAGELAEFGGVVFKCLQSHQVFDASWNPKDAASLWTKVDCANGAPAATTPPAQTPPAQTPPAQTAPAAGGGNATQCVGGPKFDPAGVKNVGNGAGRQFIGGQCLSAADCASGCCAKPCGICSGPGAQFQAGKLGCGFVAPK
jgi:carbohydrate binding protein with CBM5/12 domain